MEVLVSMGGFPVNTGSSGSIRIPGCLCIEKCDGSISPFFDCEFDVLVDRVKMGVEFSKVFSGEANMTVIDISIPPLRVWGAVLNALSSTYSITKFAKMALTGEPIGQPNICL